MRGRVGQQSSVSFDLELGEAIRSSATDSGQSVSAWLAEAARDRLRLEALADALASWQHEFGPLADAEVEEAERSLERPRTRRRKGVA